MENRVQYIIDLVVQDKKLRQQMAQLNWEEIIGSNGKGMSDAFAKGTKDAVDKIKNTFHGLNIDWDTILGSKDLVRLEQQMAKVLSSGKKQISAFASMDDTSGIQRTVEYVAELGNQLKSLGSNFDAAQLARGMTSFMKVLMPLSAKIDALAKEPKKIEDVFDRLFNGNISNGAVKVSQGFTVVGDAAGKAAIKTNQAIQQIEKGLSSIDALFSKEYNIKFKSDLEEQFYSVDEQIEKVEEDISKLESKFSKMTSSSKGFDATRSQLVQKYVKQSELYRQLDLIDKKYISKHSKDGSLLSLNNIIPEDIINKARERIELFLNDARLSLEDISKSTKTTKDGINIPIKLPTQNDLIKTINQYVDEINKSKAINTIKINLDDPANLIKDKKKRAYGASEADDDVNTTALVNKTGKRLDRIIKVFDEKLNGKINENTGEVADGLLQKTQKWRNNMLSQFKFKSGDFEFKFNDSLIDSLQSLFDDFYLKVNIDPNHIANQIKTILSSGDNTIGGGIANIDANSMKTAIAIGLKSVLFGGNIQLPQGNNLNNVDGNTLLTEEIPANTEHIATEIEGAAKHLDLAEDYVKDVVAKLKAVAKYASKDSSGAKATKTRFNELGIDLSKVKTASDVGNDAEIVSIIEKAFLQRDEFGDLKGSTIASELSKFKGSSSKTIPAFIDSMGEVFYMLQEKTQSIEDWTRKIHSREIFDSARSIAKAANALRGIRSTIRQGDIPDGESIENAISLITDIGKNTDNLQLLKTARKELGDKTDDAAILEFKTSADTFYKSSSKMFWGLKKQAEDMFKGTVFFQGKNGKKYGKYYDNYKQLASVKDDSIIVDVQVSSSLNNTALGTVKSKDGNRISKSGEKQLMRNASRTDYIIPREYEPDILNKTLTYEGFKPQGVSTQVDLNASLEANEKRKQSLLAEIQVKEEEKKSLDTEISILDNRIEELTKKNKAISQNRKEAAKEKVSDFEATQQQLSHEILMLEEKVGNGKTGEGQRIGSLTRDIEEQLRKRASAEEQLAQLSESDVERKKKELGVKISELETETPKLQDDLIKAQARYNIAESDRVMAQANVYKASAALKAIPNTKKNETARVEAESRLNQAQFALSDAIEKVNEASKDVDFATKTIERNEKQILNLKSKISETTLESVRDEQLRRIRAIDDVITNLENEFETLMAQKNAKEATLVKVNKKLEKSRNVVALKTERELDSAISERDKLKQQKARANSTIKSDQSTIETLEQTSKRIEAEREYNKLLEKSLMLQGSIKKMEEDGASESALKKKQKELDGVNAKLSESKAMVESLGGFFGQANETKLQKRYRELQEQSKFLKNSIENMETNGADETTIESTRKELSEINDQLSLSEKSLANARKTYAIGELEKIEDDLITSKAQKRILESRISKKDREIADLDKWGLSAGIGSSELEKIKRNLTYDFMQSDYVKAAENALKEKTKAAITESENESRKIFDAKVATAMEHLGWNPLDQIQVKKFLNTEHGQQLSNDFASEVDTNTTNIWKQYDEFRKNLLLNLKTDFQESFKVNKGVLTATTKTQDETGQWVNEIVETRVRETLKARLEEEKRILESQREPIQSNIDRLETDKAAAIEYGGISDKELLSGKIIEDQIEKEEYLAKLKEDRIAAQEKINSLERANIDRSSDDYKSAKKDLSNIDAEIEKYEMRIKDRQNLIQNRYDESKEPTYTNEEKELRFKNQIASCNKKIEISLAKQKTLNEQIAIATGNDRTKLERILSQEEEKVALWNEKKLKYETKLNGLQSYKTTNTTDAILPNGGIVGSIMSAVKEAIGEGIRIGTTELAKEATLRAILEVLGGSPQVTEDRVGLARGKNTNTSSTIDDAKSLYKSWNVKPQDLNFETVKAKAIELKQVIDTLYDEGKSDTIEFINAQTELSKLLSAWRNKIGKSTNPELYGKTGKENWISYLTSGNTKIFDNLNNVELSSISQKDYLSRLKRIGVETSATNAATEQKLQIEGFEEFKLQAQSLRKAIESQTANSEEQKKTQAAFVQLLQSWAKNEASGFGGKLPNAKDWKSYLISSGVFDSIDTSITPLTSRQLNKSSKSNNITSEKVSTQKSKTSKVTKSSDETTQTETRQVTSGLLQLVGQLAKENTLLQVLSALQSIGTVEGGKIAPTAAGDLYNQFKALLLGGSIDDHERLAYMNSKEDLISGNVIGNIANISEGLINALRAKYPSTQGFDTQVHTHGKSNNPYFSDEDYNHFTKDYESGIKKQVLLTKDDISVLDLTAVKSAEEVQHLMDELIRAGNNAEAIRKVFETNQSGAIFETAKFDSLNADSLVKMIGGKGDNSNNTMTEINAMTSKLKSAREDMAQAVDIGYLSKNDSNLAEFDKILNRTNEISESIKKGTASYEAQKSELDKLASSATRYSNIISSTIEKNKRAYVGVSEVNSVNKQRDKIISAFGSEDQFNNSNIALVQNYNQAVKNLNATYKELTSTQKIQNESERQSLNQQALQVQTLGKHLLSSISEADKLRQLVEQSGIYKDKTGVMKNLGGYTNVNEVKDLNATMRDYVQNTLGQANIEHAKFDAVNKRLTYTFRTTKKTVADMVVQYDDLTKSLYVYQKQERESLSGFPGLIQGFKSKMRSILQYTTSITSIYRVFYVIRQGFTYIKEIDSALTELKKVTDETEATYDKFLNTAAKTADKVGSTIKDVVSSTADWARLGYSMQEAAQLAESTQILMNVSEFTDISTATDSLISSIQANINAWLYRNMQLSHI